MSQNKISQSFVELVEIMDTLREQCPWDRKQTLQSLRQLTIEETIFASDIPILKIIEAYENALKNPEDEDAYQLAFEGMDSNNAWEFENQYQQTLSQLKLDDLSLKVNTLSGGQKKRLALAQALLSKPDILI